ncbi:hypothetical protein [Bacillus cereus]
MSSDKNLAPFYQDYQLGVLDNNIYHFPTENSYLKEWVGHGPMSR